MKLALWVLLGFAVDGSAFWAVASGLAPKNPAVEFVIFVLFTLPSVGAFWMMYMAIRYEKKPVGYIVLAFVPFTFLWYYFERVRPGALVRRHAE
jgi:hypothetical protein